MAETLSEEWSSCDNTWMLKNWLALVLERKTYPQLMSETELEVFDRLPDVVTIYRGCGRGVNMTGISWSLDENIARAFPTYGRYSVKRPVLITATVKKSKIIALKLDCDEQEVITFSANRVSVKDL